MGIKLDYDVNTVLTPWRVTCQQTNAYEGEADTEIKSIYVIAPDKAAATFWAEEELTSHGDIFDVLAWPTSPINRKVRSITFCFAAKLKGRLLTSIRQNDTLRA